MNCDYADSDDVLIDLLISGVRHKKIQERLLDQGQDITLKRAVEIGQQFELTGSGEIHERRRSVKTRLACTQETPNKELCVKCQKC